MKRPALGWALAALAAAGFAALGSWQLGRAQWKQALLADVAATLAERAPRPLAALAGADDEGLAWAAGEARFLDTPVLLLDNQRRGQAVGVRVYCAAAADGGPALLVDLGWRPLPPDRRLPDTSCPSGRLALAGLLAPPPAVGLRLGSGLAAQPGGRAWLATRVEPDAVAAAWGLPALAPRVLRLDPALPLGYERDLDALANTLPPEKHRGYALQWFGLAAAALAIPLVLSLRRRP